MKVRVLDSCKGEIEMFKIALNEIYLTKGDTARFSISIDSNSNEGYTLTEEDKVYFIVTKRPDIVPIESLDNNPDSYVFYKSGIDVVIEPEDTQNLDREVYYYQVRVVLSQNNDVNTLIEPQELYLTPRRVI